MSGKQVTMWMLLVAAEVSGCARPQVKPTHETSSTTSTTSTTSTSSTTTTSTAACPCPIASAQQNPFAIAVNATHVYWTNSIQTGGSVSMVPLDGGAPILLGASEGLPVGVAVDTTYAYWVDQVTGTVTQFPLAGGKPVILASKQGEPAGIAVDATDPSGNLYWTAPSDVNGGTVYKMAKISGAPIALVSDPDLTMLGPITVDAVNVYYADSFAGIIAYVPIAGGLPTTLFKPTGMEPSEPVNLRVDAAHVYWTDLAAGTINMVPIAGGPATVLASGQNGPYGIAIDASNVYWTTQDGNVMMVPLTGADAGVPTMLASGQHNPAQIAVDATSVYWANEGSLPVNANMDGTIMKLAK